MTFPIPDAALDKHIAFLGATGSGKTSAAKSGVVEVALGRSERVLVIDPTSAWWGLRLGRDGKGKGFPIYIFGGDHGDYPLRARDAKVLAETFGTSSDSAVFDTSLMTVTERTQFFTEFAEEIRRKNHGPLKLVIDEAHLFMPQSGATSGGSVPAMLHAGNNLVSLGRSRGLRITLISQRPAKLHKDSLTQVQTLVAMRLMAPQDRKAVSEWIKDQADPTKEKEIVASLASFKPGEAWVWAPMADVLARVKFPMPQTFDSSRAPDMADGKGPSLAPINLDALKGRLASVEAETKANDPKALKAEVARLAKELATKPKETADPAAIDTAFAQGRNTALKAMAKFGGELATSVKRAQEACENAQRLLDSFATFADTQASHKPAPIAQRIEHRTSNPRVASSNLAGRANGSSVTLPVGERAVLVAAAQFDGVDRDQLSVLTGYKRSSRDAYIQRLREKGFIEISGQTIRPTEGGLAALPADYEPLPTGEDLQAYWLARLPEGERRILSELIAAYPDTVPRATLDDATGYKRSSRDAYIQRMKSKRVIEIEPNGVRASERLFA